MEDFQTEEQQVEAIKRFWHEHGNSIIAGIVLGFGGFVGFNWYQDNKVVEETARTEAYIEFQETLVESPDKLSAQAETFLAQHGQSSYASLAEFTLAKAAVEEKDWTKAEQHLNNAIAQAADKNIAAVATLRLAKVQIQSEQIDAALTTLAATLPESFKASVEEIKGDAYLLQGKKELARNAYQTAVDSQKFGANPGLQMKLDDLAETFSLNK